VAQAVSRSESGMVSHANKGPGDGAWYNESDNMIAVLKRNIAMLEVIDKQYRPMTGNE
jgi:hypothetical protein